MLNTAKLKVFLEVYSMQYRLSSYSLVPSRRWGVGIVRGLEKSLNLISRGAGKLP